MVKQSGTPSAFASCSRLGLRIALVPLGGGGAAGPATAGCTPPPMTSATVFTTVPCDARALSQSRSDARSVGEMALLVQPLHTLCNTTWAQPPPDCSAFVMADSIAERLSEPLATSRVAY